MPRKNKSNNKTGGRGGGKEKIVGKDRTRELENAQKSLRGRIFRFGTIEIALTAILGATALVLRLTGFVIPLFAPTLVISPADIFVFGGYILGGPFVGILVGIIYSLGSPWWWVSMLATGLLFPVGIYSRLMTRKNHPLLWWAGFYIVLLLIYCPMEAQIVTFAIFGLFPTGQRFIVAFSAIAIAMIIDSIPTLIILELVRKTDYGLISRFWP